MSQLQWEKMGLQYVAHIGQSMLTVVPIGPNRRKKACDCWVVGEVLGVPFNRRLGEWTTPEDAFPHAEAFALQLIDDLWMLRAALSEGT